MGESASPAFTRLKNERQVTCRFTVLLYTCISAPALALALVGKPRSAGYGNREIYLFRPTLYLSLGFAYAAMTWI